MPPELDFPTMASDVVMKGNLRKARNWNKRFFVLRDTCPAKLEYYENERKWKSSNSKPKRTIILEKAWNMAKKKDAKHEFLIVIFTEDECFSMAADNAEIQESWINALQKIVKQESGCLFYKHMWYVNLDSKDLECCKIRLHGPHLVCLTNDQMVLVPANCNGGADHSRGDPVEIPIASIRVCGHKKSEMFIAPGRASGIGSGKLWMVLGDEVMAAGMHQTVLRLMYALKGEESYSYRGRSYSSGSNSGRVRSVRSHHNNPPPSLIGMGKAPGALSLNKRIRCDSMPASHVTSLINSRLRTGSEGEHTLRRSSQSNSVRSHNGSSSTAMRGRFHKIQGRRNSFLHHQQHVTHILHKHVSSFSTSCNASSTDSSSEYLNNVTDFSSLMAYDGAAIDEFLNGHCPIQNGGQCSLRNKSICRHVALCQDNWSGPTREIYASDRPCSCCSYTQPSGEEIGRIPYLQQMAPPPPEIDPPHNPLIHSSSLSTSRDFVDFSATSRTNSIEDCENCSTPASSLSSSPRQSSPPIQVADFTDGCHTPDETSSNDYCNEQVTSSSSSSSKRQSPLTVPPESFSNAQDDYTPMNLDTSHRYPHQNMSAPQPKATNHSFLSKVASFAGLSSHSQNSSTIDDPDYTPMNLRSSAQTPPPADGYVPMKSLLMKSVPQDIAFRRRSIPDNIYRNMSSRGCRSSPPIPDDSVPCQFCQECYERARRQFVFKQSPHSFTSTKDCRNCVHNSQEDLEKSVGVNSGHLAPPIFESARISTPNPNDDVLNMQHLHHEIGEVEKCLYHTKTDCNESNVSMVSPSSDSSTEINGYLPMSPVNPLVNGHSRKGVFNSILSVAENHCHNTPIALYPHQRKDYANCTNSLDRPKKEIRSKRAKSLTSFRRNSSFTRRSQSVKERHSIDNSIEANSSLPALAVPSRTLGGDYVNIDFRKAQGHLKCPCVISAAAP